MAAKLQCEICGGRLIGKPGGIFECENCGMEFSTEWAKAKIQEISGTVKVEGTVEVTGKVQIDGGTVQVEGAANAVSYLRRGDFALEDCNWDDALDYYDKVLDIEPENVQAYLGKLLAKYQCRSTEELKKRDGFDTSKEYQRLMRFGDEKIKAELADCVETGRAYVAEMQERIEKRRLEREAEEKAKKEEREAREKAEEIERTNYLKAVLPSVGGKMGIFIAVGSRNKVVLRSDGTVSSFDSSFREKHDTKQWNDIVAVSSGDTFSAGLKSDGTVVTTEPKFSVYKKWEHIIAISAGDYHMVALKEDGTVVAEGHNLYGQCEVAFWKDIVAVSAGRNHTVGLRSDGSVVATKSTLLSHTDQSDMRTWKDIVAVAAGGDHTIGLKKDGTVVAVGDNNYGACNVEEWREIVAISTNTITTAGLKSDGTVLTTNHQRDYKGIVAIAGGGDLRLRLDGTIDGREGLIYGKLFDSFEDEWNRIKEREEKWRKVAEERETSARRAKSNALNAEKESLQAELHELKGMFSSKRRKEIEDRLSVIDKELRKLR